LVHGKAAQLTLVTSPQMKDQLTQLDVCSNIAIWKKGVDSEVFHPRYRCPDMKFRLTQGHPEDKVMLYVGRLGHEKNLKALRDILHHANNTDDVGDDKRVRLAFVGDGPAREDLAAHFAETDTVFLGEMRGEELSQAYASADVFVMPSETETLGFVVLEAMASGVPAVCVDAGGIPDIITETGDRGHGYLYPPGDLEEAAKLVRHVVSDEARRVQIGQQARKHVLRWDWKAATEFLLTQQYTVAVAAARVYWGDKFKKSVLRPLPADAYGGDIGGAALA